MSSQVYEPAPATGTPTLITTPAENVLRATFTDRQLPSDMAIEPPSTKFSWSVRSSLTVPGLYPSSRFRALGPAER